MLGAFLINMLNMNVEIQQGLKKTCQVSELRKVIQLQGRIEG